VRQPTVGAKQFPRTASRSPTFAAPSFPGCLLHSRLSAECFSSRAMPRITSNSPASARRCPSGWRSASRFSAWRGTSQRYVSHLIAHNQHTRSRCVRVVVPHREGWKTSSYFLGPRCPHSHPPRCRRTGLCRPGWNQQGHRRHDYPVLLRLQCHPRCDGVHEHGGDRNQQAPGQDGRDCPPGPRLLLGEQSYSSSQLPR
jgi:hypothetical protein